VDFVEAYGVRHQGYSHVVVATMAIVMFGGMCRYDDASGMLWWNIRFEADGSGYELSFDTRNNAQCRQGNKVLVAPPPLSAVCPVRLLRELQFYTGGRRTCTYSVDSTGGWLLRARARLRRGLSVSRMISFSVS
jgi:hypothetical protein